MGLIKLSQETDGKILNHVQIGGHDWTQLNMFEDCILSINQNNNNN